MRPALLLALATTALASATPTAPALAQGPGQPVFNRIATYPIAANLPPGADPKKKTVAEIVAASEDGRLLIYANSERDALGFVDIGDPAAPKGAGEIGVGGEPTSVTVVGTKAVVVVSTGKDKTAPAGYLGVVDLATKRIEGRCDLGGQPDSIARSPDGRFVAVVIENERDEKLDKGKIPQAPAGELKVFPIQAGAPDCAAMRSVALTGLALVAPEDPEPEYLDINAAGEAVVTLQENNHLAVVNLAEGRVVAHFPAGSVDLDRVDTKRDRLIRLDGQVKGAKREPDAVKWLDASRFVTANEGDYEGGSRGFTIFNRDGRVEWDSGSTLEHLAAGLGHSPEARAGAKGVEPEGVEVARFGGDTLIFVGLERASLVAVYRDRGPGQAPEYLQALPAGVGPEGLLAIPSRDLFVAASEVDDPETGNRSSISIYRRGPGSAAYPTILSADGAGGLPLAWGALSGLSPDPANPARLFAVTDSYYAEAKIVAIDTAATPARITSEIVVTRDGKPAETLDIEGVAARRGGGFWLASEGNPERKEGALDNLLLRVSADGRIEEEVRLPASVTTGATRFGFEGVAVTGEGADETVWVALQREWKGDPQGHAKLARYRPAAKEWAFLHYPLDPAGAGWVGLSDLAIVGGDLIVLERDNQMGEAAKVKKLTRVALSGVTPAPEGQPIPVVTKTLVRDLLADLRATGGAVLEKVEGFTVAPGGDAFIVTDNDGVAGTSGETQFLRLGRLDGAR